MCKKINLITKILPIGVIACGILGAHLYLNHEAESQYNAYIQKIEDRNPNIKIETKNVSYNPISSRFTAENVLVTSKDKIKTIRFKEISYTKPGDKKGFPDRLDYSVRGLEVNVESINFETADQRDIGIYLAGDDKIIEINAFGSERVDEAGDRIVLSSTLDVERLGNVSVNLNLDGFYGEFNKSLKSGDVLTYKDFTKLLKEIAVSDLGISMKSENLTDFLNLVGKQSNKEPSDVLLLLKKARNAIKSSAKEQDIGHDFDNLLAAYNLNKELIVSFSFGNVINNQLIMTLIKANKPDDTSFIKVALGLEVTTKVK